jgi:hypothetical protein
MVKKVKGLREADLYPLVRRWLDQQGYDCGDEQTRWWEDLGPQRTRLDVIGLKSIGGRHHDDVEIVGVEVKKHEKARVADVNQTLGYRRFVDRAYFAKPGPYRPELVQEAVRFGIGLLTIDPENDDDPIKVVLTAAISAPHPEQRAQLLEKMWVGRCRLCGIYFGRYDTWDSEAKPTYVELKRQSEFRGKVEGGSPKYRPTLCAACAELLGYTKQPTATGFKWVEPQRG